MLMPSCPAGIRIAMVRQLLPGMGEMGIEEALPTKQETQLAGKKEREMVFGSLQ